MKIHISGPMTGIEDMNRPLFNEVANSLRMQEHEVFNPAEIDKKLSYRAAMMMNLNYICLEAEAVCLLPGCEKSKGSMAERMTAVACGIDIFTLIKRPGKYGNIWRIGNILE